MKLFLVLLVIIFVGFGNGLRTTKKPIQSKTVKYFTKQNQPLTIHMMFHMDPVLTNRLAKLYRSRTRTKLKEISQNIVKDVEKFFQHRSLNQTIRLKLKDTRFIKNNTNSVTIVENASKYLESYCAWQTKKKMMMEKLYYSVLLTGLDLYYVNQRGEEMRRSTGRSYMSSMCTVNKSCTLIEWHPKNIGFLLAHEIAHGLGINHDDATSTQCRGYYMMRSAYNGRNHPNTWSKCSQQSLKRYIQSHKSWCIKAEQNP